MMLPHSFNSRWRSFAAAVFLLLVALTQATATPAPARDIIDPAPGRAETIAEQIERWRSDEVMRPGTVVVDPLIADRIELISQRSPRFRRAWLGIEASGAAVLVGSKEDLMDVIPDRVQRSNAWAGVTLTWGERDGTLERSAIVIRVEWLRQLYARYGNSEQGFLDALDGLIIHEIYGHLTPVVVARNTGAHCPDPVAGQRLADSCVGRRELEIRREGIRLAADAR